MTSVVPLKHHAVLRCDGVQRKFLYSHYKGVEEALKAARSLEEDVIAFLANYDAWPKKDDCVAFLKMHDVATPRTCTRKAGRASLIEHVIGEKSERRHELMTQVRPLSLQAASA